jgi:hypothetical protein
MLISLINYLMAWGLGHLAIVADIGLVILGAVSFMPRPSPLAGLDRTDYFRLLFVGALFLAIILIITTAAVTQTSLVSYWGNWIQKVIGTFSEI